jgi:hypothetical protein
MRGITMKSGWKVFWLFAVVFAVAFGLERTLVPHIVPVAFADEPQPLWSVETAFILRAIELMAGGVAAIALSLVLLAWLRRIAHRRAQ